MCHIERLDPSLNAVTVFRRLAHLSHVLFLDSAARTASTGRYSFVAADPIQWWDSADSLAKIERVAAGLDQPARSDLPPFQGGLAGMFGYELAPHLERVPVAKIDEFQIPPLALGLYDVVFAFDHDQNAAWLIAQSFADTDAQARARFFLGELASPHGELASASGNTATDSTRLPASSLAPQHPTGIEHLTSNFSHSAYLETVRRAIDYIAAGDVYQVNLSQRLLHPATDSPINLYCRLRERNPAPMAGYLDGGGWQIASASPERFLRVADRRVETRPIKGTAALTRDATVDRAAAHELSISPKDRAENVMIVDLLRNDLSRACQAASVRVTQLCGLESYAWVQHLVSVVEGTLRDGVGPFDLLKGAFPGGSVTGVPKIRAIEIIAELEPTVRGPYCGSLGYLGVGGQMDTNILIRTITAARGWWQIPVGGGIVADSDPQREYDETWHKAKGMLQALRP
ncbi:MAG: anthranilate synthase component I family protein [Pirellulales bacterium]